MTLKKTAASLAIALLLTACAASEPDADTTDDDAAAAAVESTDAASQTVAVYGDEAPVAIEPEAADDHDHGDGDHAH